MNILAILRRARGIAFASALASGLLWGSVAAAFELTAPSLKDGVITLRVGEEVQAAVLDNGQPVEKVRYESGNPGFFSVKADTGLLKGVHEGMAQLSASAAGKSDTVMVVVLAKDGSYGKFTSAGRREAVNDIVVANEGGVVRTGFIERIIAHLLPYNAVGRNPFTIASSNPAVMAVDDTVKTVEALKPGRATITVATLDGKFKTAVNYEVVAPPPPPALKTYAIEPARFAIKYDTDDEAASKANSAALQAALDYTAANGFNHLLLEKDKKFYVNPRDTVYMVSNVRFDLNGSEILLRPNSYTNYTAFMFGSRGGHGSTQTVDNASIVNGTITGERDHKEQFLPNWKKIGPTEGSCAVNFNGGRNNGIRNLTVRKSIGFNIASGIGPIAPDGRFANRRIGKRHVEEGTFDAAGKPVAKPGMIRTKEPIDMSKLTGGTYVLGFPLGYMGYPHMNSRIFDVWYFDAANKLIKTERGRFRYRMYDIPKGAHTAHFALYHDGIPEKEEGDFSAFVFVESRNATLDNYIIDCTIDDNFSCGVALCGGQRWIVRGNSFHRNGGRMPGFDLVWEDGWDYMQGDLVENNTFESGNNIVVCAGSGIIFRRNTFKGAVLIYGRTQNGVFIDNECIGGRVDLSAQSDFHTARNTYRKTTVNIGRQHVNWPGAEYRGMLADETFEQSNLHGKVGLAEVTRCTFKTDGKEPVNLSARFFNDCTFGPGTYRFVSGTFRKAATDNAIFSMDKGGALEFYDSKLLNPVFSAGAQSLGLNVERCAIAIDKPLTFLTPGNMNRARIANSAFTLARDTSPFIFSGGWNSKDATTRVDIDSLKFQAAAGFEGYLHKFNWYAPAEDEAKITYNLVKTTLPAGFKLTDEKGEKSNAAFLTNGKENKNSMVRK